MCYHDPFGIGIGTELFQFSLRERDPLFKYGFVRRRRLGILHRDALAAKLFGQPPQPVVRAAVVGKAVKQKDALLWHGDILAQAPPKVTS